MVVVEWLCGGGGVVVWWWWSGCVVVVEWLCGGGGEVQFLEILKFSEKYIAISSGINTRYPHRY